MTQIPRYYELKQALSDERKEQVFQTHVQMNMQVIKQRMGKPSVALFDGGDSLRMAGLFANHGYTVSTCGATGMPIVDLSV